MRRKKNLKLGAMLLAGAMSLAVASAQSFNIDMDSEFAPPQLGGGAPSSTFGGAAHMPGYWNKISAAGFGTNQLRGLDGSITSARIVGPDGGIGGGHNNPLNSGNFAALLNDARDIGRTGEITTVTFDGLISSRYLLYTYSVRINNGITNTKVRVPDALNGELQITSGPMPGNSFALGKTHTVHELLVSSGSFTMTIEGGADNSYLNGFQLVAVPEPVSILAVTFGAGLFGLGKGSRRRAKD